MIEQAYRPASKEELPSRSICRHYWIIEAPTGPVSIGACRLCKEVREFKNYIEEAPQVDDELIVEPIA